MKTIFMILLSTHLFAQNFTEKQINRLKEKKEITYSDLAHENPGCLENSYCSEEMGKLIARLKAVLESRSPYRGLKSFHQKHGLPLNHFTRNTDEQTVYFSSRCRQHNPKDGEGIKTVEAYRFLKDFHSNPNTIFESAQVLDSELTYSIPLRDTPYYIKNKKLITMKEFEDYHFYLAINSNGNFSVVEPNKDELEKAFDYSENIQECPKNENLREDFMGSYCRQIYNFDLKKVQVIRIDWACP